MLQKQCSLRNGNFFMYDFAVVVVIAKATAPIFSNPIKYLDAQKVILQIFQSQIFVPVYVLNIFLNELCLCLKTRLQASSAAIISKSRLKEHTITLQWGCWQTNNDSFKSGQGFRLDIVWKKGDVYNPIPQPLDQF